MRVTDRFIQYLIEMTYLKEDGEYGEVIGRLLLNRDTGGYLGCFVASKLCWLCVV